MISLMLGASFAALAITGTYAAGPSPVAVEYHLESLTPGVSRGDDGIWVVPVGERIEWVVTWTVSNRSLVALKNVAVVNRYSAEIFVDPASVVGSQGQVAIEPVGHPRSATRVLWGIGSLSPGQTAMLTFRIATRTNPQGKQMYGEPGEYCLDSGLNVGWKGGSLSMPCVGVRAVEPAWLRVEVSASRTDWRIRKPGDYAALAFRAVIASNQDVTFQFQEFGDLMAEDAAGGEIAHIPAFYAMGEDLSAASASGWQSAEELNGQTVQLPRSAALEEGIPWSLWQRVIVGPGARPAAYEDEAAVVFMLANVAELVVEGP